MWFGSVLADSRTLSCVSIYFYHTVSNKYLYKFFFTEHFNTIWFFACGIDFLYLFYLFWPGANPHHHDFGFLTDCCIDVRTKFAECSCQFVARWKTAKRAGNDSACVVEYRGFVGYLIIGKWAKFFGIDVFSRQLVFCRNVGKLYSSFFLAYSQRFNFLHVDKHGGASCGIIECVMVLPGGQIVGDAVGVKFLFGNFIGVVYIEVRQSKREGCTTLGKDNSVEACVVANQWQTGGNSKKFRKHLCGRWSEVQHGGIEAMHLYQRFSGPQKWIYKTVILANCHATAYYD